MRLDLPLDFEYEYFDVDGKRISSEIGCLAKKSISNRTNRVQYHILTCHGELYNIHEGNINYAKKDWVMTKVPQEIFDLYLRFLRTKRTTFLVLARRT